MLQGEHSAILLTFIKLPFVIKIFVLSVFKWPLKTGFTVSYRVYYTTQRRISRDMAKVRSSVVVWLHVCFCLVCDKYPSVILFDFVSLRAINNISVKQGRVFLG